MQKKICITFSGKAYDATTKRIVESAPRFGADEVWVYDDRWLLEERKAFCDKNRWAFDHPHKRGFGWYIWKPFIILDALDRASDGDIVLFIDADTYPIRDISVLYETCEKDGGLMLFSVAGQRQRPWCKRDCYIVMGQDDARYYDEQAAVARFMLFQKGKAMPRKLLEEWLAFTCDPRANTFDKSALGPEIPGFVEHRCEQAILTNLAHKYGVRLYREACQQGERFSYDKDLYPTLFHQDFGVVKKHGNKTTSIEGSSFRNIDIK